MGCVRGLLVACLLWNAAAERPVERFGRLAPSSDHAHDTSRSMEQVEARLEGVGRLAVTMQAVTLNDGEMSTNEVKSAAQKILTAAVGSSRNHSIVVITAQEVKEAWLPDLTDTPWTVYKTHLGLNLGYMLQTLVFVRHGLQVKTTTLPEDMELDDFVAKNDDEAEACKTGQATEDGCSSYGVKHNCVGVVGFRSCTKGSSVSVMEMYLPSKVGVPEVSAILVIANSHMGYIKDPLESQMVSRASELSQLMRFVKTASGAFKVPVLMMGDWNFRFSPLSGMKAAIEAKSEKLAEFLESHYQHVGPIIGPDRDGKMHLSNIASPGQKLQGHILYDEYTVGRELLGQVAAHKSEDFADAIPEDMVGFAMLVDGGFQAREDDLPLTCKYKELSEGQTRTPVEVDSTLEVAGLTDFDPLQENSNDMWADFTAATHNLKIDSKGHVKRAPSRCDKVTWSPGSLQGEALALNANHGIGAVDDGDIPELTKTDHIALTAVFDVTLFEQGVALKLREAIGI